MGDEESDSQGYEVCNCVEIFITWVFQIKIVLNWNIKNLGIKY